MADITINLRADPSQFESGVKAAESAIEEWENSSGDSADVVAKKLEQVIRTLVKLGTESGKTGDEMRSDLRKFGLTAEQAEDAVEAVWKEMREGKSAARDVEAATDALNDTADAAAKVGDASKKTGTDVSELGNIARDVLEGDFASAAEGAIGALSAIGLFAGAGGALGTAIGQGVVAAGGFFLQEWTKVTEATKQLVAEMYDDMVENGRAALSDQFVTNKIAEIYDPENVDQFNRAVELSNQLGIERSTIIRAMAGDEEANQEIIGQSRDRLADLNAQQEAYIAANGRESSALADKIGEIERGSRAYEILAGAQDTAAGRAREAIDAINETAGAASTAAGKIDGVSLALNSMPPGKTVVIDADTSAYFAQVEAIRRQTISKTVEFDYVINERRGRTLLE